MQRVLIIDDDAAVGEVLKLAIKKSLPHVECDHETRFETGVTRLRKERFDAVVLDLRQGDALPGQQAWQDIWTGRFCPVVIYTAVGDELDPPLPKDHAFVKRITKGSGTEAKVVEVLKAFAPQVAAIARLHDELDITVQRALRDTAGAGIVKGDDPAHLVHAARRRVAAMMDDRSATEGRALFSWEQYLIPPVGDSPLTGDLLRKAGARPEEVTAYRLLLTPSCDMVRGQKPNDTVLVAKCYGPDKTIAACRTLPKRDADAAESLRMQALTPSCVSGVLPLPAFPGRIPHLSASLKDLEVLALASIGAVGADGYERVASIDSPFREQVSWAFLTTVARPGMPERDLDAWASDLLKTRPAPPTAPAAAAVAPKKPKL